MIKTDKIHGGVSVEVEGMSEDLKEEYAGILEALLKVDNLKVMVLTTTRRVFRDRLDPDGKIYDDVMKAMGKGE